MPITIDGTDYAAHVVEGGELVPYDTQLGDGTVIHQHGLPEPVGTPFIWYPADEGTGTALTDNVGTHHATINGPAWLAGSGTYVGDWALSGDGLDDWIQSTQWGTFGSEMITDMAIAFTAEIAPGSNGYLIGVSNSGNSTRLLIGPRDFVNNSQGQMGFEIRDDGLNRINVSTDATYDDDVRRRFVINKTGNTYSDLSIWVNGTQAPASFPQTGTISNTSNFDLNVGILSNSTPSNFSDAVVDDIVVYLHSLTAQQIGDDLARQPGIPA